MRIEKFLVWFTGAFFLVYGISFALFPHSLSNMVTGGVPTTTSGLIDMRATYGGMAIAVGLLILLLGSKESTLKLGLLSVILVLMGMATTRTIGFFIDGNPNSLMTIYLVAEIVPSIIALVLYRRLE